jgi:hypothetical protein
MSSVYGYENRCLKLKEKNRLRVCENREGTEEDIWAEEG